MPETNIDQSAGITSIRLKVPTGTVPVPPAGFGQLHSPSPGVLALRLPDGSVVEIVLASGGGGSGRQIVGDPITVSSAALQALGTPIVLVAAQGPGKLLVPISAVFVYHAGETPYTVTPGSGLSIGLPAASGQADLLVVGLEGFLDASTDKIASGAAGGFRLDDPALATNQPLVLGVSSGDPPTSGDGSLTVIPTYQVVSLVG